VGSAHAVQTDASNVPLLYLIRSIDYPLSTYSLAHKTLIVLFISCIHPGAWSLLTMGVLGLRVTSNNGMATDATATVTTAAVAACLHTCVCVLPFCIVRRRRRRRRRRATVSRQR
jgi:ABC-type proline/glycine betaine transport system permease subunit